VDPFGCGGHRWGAVGDAIGGNSVLFRAVVELEPDPLALDDQSPLLDDVAEVGDLAERVEVVQVRGSSFRGWGATKTPDRIGPGRLKGRGGFNMFVGRKVV
jgi:hypothetical protein